LLEDYVLVLAVGVAAATVVVLCFTLARYKQVSSELDKSVSLAKDLWGSMNSRFLVIDSRVVDLMAKVEVLSDRVKPLQGRVSPVAQLRGELGIDPKAEGVVSSLGEAAETERRVLESLLTGPKTSGQIREIVGRSREHTARLLKVLFERGFVVRNAVNKPYVYEITERGRSYLGT